MTTQDSEKKRKGGNKRTERVAMMVDHFYEEFMRGLNPEEISEKYGVSKNYWRILVSEIAEKHNVSPELFYQRKHGMHVILDDSGRIVPKRATFEEINMLLDEAEELLQKTQKTFSALEKEMLAALEELNT